MLSSRTFILSMLLLLCTPAAAFGADDDGQVDPATQELIQQGIALRRSGKDDAALRIFLDAEARSPSSVRVLLHVTAAAQAAGRWLLAYRYLQKASSHRTEPYYQRYRASIQVIEDAVAQHVGQLRVLGSPSGAEVLVNGELVGTLPMDNPKVLELGAYQLEVRKSGYFPLRRPLEIVGGTRLSQEAIELKPMTPSLASAPESRPSGRAETKNGETRPGSQSPLRARWITYALAGTGVALLATSSVAFALREREAGRWNDDSRCLDGSSPTVTRAQVCGDVRGNVETDQRIGIVTGVLGLGFGGAALAHWLATSERSRVETGQARRLPACSVGLGSVTCQGTF
jgi:hypothetical protein